MLKKKIEIKYSKLNLPIIQVEHNGHMLPVHSKYNPIVEAERLIDSYSEQIEQSDHIFFYGVGLGYHVKIAQQRYPEKLISTYEPIANIYPVFAENAEKIGINLKEIANQYVEHSKEDIRKNLTHFKIYFAQRIMILIHPVYEKIAFDSLKQFSESFQQFVQDVRSNKQTNFVFNDRWVINEIMNALWTFNTPNILAQTNNPFKGKPIVLVAAGPSLSAEINHLQYIKENRLAYIFAVGSANEALIKHNIYPDAVLSYDPSVINYQVFLELVKQNITNVPLIFGTSIGHETITMYPGPKIHMVMQNDTITPYIHDEVFETVNDAGTISNITLQLVYKLNVEQVILVGQNFAYKNNLFYAPGINRYDQKEYIESVLEKIELDGSLYVDDVYGGKVETEQVYDQMRREMEVYLQQMPNLKVVNTTQGGAKIEGTKFQSLADVINTELKKPVVTEKWWKCIDYPKNIVKCQVIDKLEKASEEYRILFHEMMEILERLEKKNDSNNPNQLNRMLDKMYKLLSQITKNILFKTIIEPIISVHTERFYSNVKLCQRITDNSEKIKRVTIIYREYMLITLDIYRKINPILQLQLITKMKYIEQLHYYEATCGAIHYEKDWRKKWFLRKEQNGEIGNYGASVETMQQGAVFSFKFSGHTLQLIGTNAVKSALKLKITIDQYEKIISINEYIDEKFSTFHHQILFETSKLSEGLHEVKVEILSKDVHFNLLGIRISNKGRIYHIDEVENIGDLKIGKRIRCHYESKFDTNGEFINLGQSTSEYLPVQAITNPNGDFYFIMVNEVNEKKMLIADRVLQNRVSKKAIGKREILVGNKKCIISLLSSSKDKKNSEWDRYLVEQLDVKCNNLQWNADSFTASWVEDIDSESIDQGVLRGSYIGEDESLQLDNGFEYCCTSSTSEPKMMTGYRPKLEI